MKSNCAKAAAVVAMMALAPTVGLAQSAPEPSTCLFYEHFDYEGEHFGLYKRDMLTTSDQVAKEGVYGDGPVGNAFVAPQWAGRVSSLKVPNGCFAIVYNGSAQAVAVRSDLRAFSGDYNDRSVGFGCHCP